MVEACEENNVLGDSACHDAEEFAIADDQNDDPMNQEIYTGNGRPYKCQLCFLKVPKMYLIW